MRQSNQSKNQERLDRERDLEPAAEPDWSDLSLPEKFRAAEEHPSRSELKRELRNLVYRANDGEV